MNNGEKIRALRKSVGLSANGLAKIIGVSRSYISQVENGLSNASDALVEEVSMKLKTPWSDDVPKRAQANVEKAKRTVVPNPFDLAPRLDALCQRLERLASALERFLDEHSSTPGKSAKSTQAQSPVKPNK